MRTLTWLTFAQRAELFPGLAKERPARMEELVALLDRQGAVEETLERARRRRANDAAPDAHVDSFNPLHDGPNVLDDEPSF
ncbi:hypothetical protein DQ384_39320 [Sphaerisporangium album]|uniref:Uncharacterized protein n=1 Tax=Sphaerisporangium album TaxID=509200 RepID=A0A367EKT3_9ACTN|nr:hypothetical protein [Sphaerisporangium album]RCG18245.1 hypothetical protein DQ384_39320 [Sphaerisporangium album]